MIMIYARFITQSRRRIFYTAQRLGGLARTMCFCVTPYDLTCSGCGTWYLRSSSFSVGSYALKCFLSRLRSVAILPFSCIKCIRRAARRNRADVTKSRLRCQKFNMDKPRREHIAYGATRDLCALLTPSAGENRRGALLNNTKNAKISG